MDKPDGKREAFSIRYCPQARAFAHITTAIVIDSSYKEKMILLPFSRHIEEEQKV